MMRPLIKHLPAPPKPVPLGDHERKAFGDRVAVEDRQRWASRKTRSCGGWQNGHTD
jgi:hypothetical protein